MTPIPVGGFKKDEMTCYVAKSDIPKTRLSTRTHHFISDSQGNFIVDERKPMTDADKLNWIQEHLDGFRHTMRDDDQSPYELSWIDDNGVAHVTIGNNLRDCIDHAAIPIQEIN